MKVLAVIQARMKSSRLPHKALLPLCAKPLLQRLLDRVRAAHSLDQIVVATTASADDDPIRELCRRIGVSVYSGHPTDLLDRHYRAGVQFGADAVVKIPSDCPLIDPSVIDRVVTRFRDLTAGPGIDFVSNLHPPTYPDGNDVEIMPMPILETAWREAGRDYEREHTTPFIWDRPDRFRIDNVRWDSGRDLSMSHRFTIDYSEDYAFIRLVFEVLHTDGASPFSLDDILELLEERPELLEINGHLAGVNWYRHHIGRLRTVGREHTLMLEDA